MIKAFTSLGAIDGIQHASYNVAALTTIWLSKVKWPGRDLPENELWQVEELELMTPDDYDAIVKDGYAAWLQTFIAREGLGAEFELFMDSFVPSLPAAFKAWEEVGIPVLSPVIFTIPYEYFCGGRSMREFILDLHPQARPGRGGHAGDACPSSSRRRAQVSRGLGLVGLAGWGDGARRASSSRPSSGSASSCRTTRSCVPWCSTRA